MSNTYEKLRNEVLAGGATEDQDVTVGGARALLGVGAIVGLLVVLAFVNIWTFVFVVGLLISVFLHETGHFITARRSGMKVTQFFMGMGPKLWSFRRGEIEYGVRALPIGAFVRIVGMNNLDETPEEDEARTYRSKSYPKRMLTITAGSIMHMIIAIVLLFTVYSTWGKRETQNDRIGIAAVEKDSAASLAGLRANDTIVSLAGTPITSLDDVATEVHKHAPGEAIAVVVDRKGQQLTLTATLGKNPDTTAANAAYLGIRSGPENIWVEQSLGSAFTSSFTDLGTAAWDSVGGVLKVMNPVNIYDHLSGANKDQTTQPVTVYGISRLSSTIGNESGLAGILLTLAGINVFIGLLNMTPLLPFDGGHAAVATYERIRSRRGTVYRADVGKMIPVAMTVMTFLVFVMFAGLYLDITNPIK